MTFELFKIKKSADKERKTSFYFFIKTSFYILRN